ncbi:MAG: hypothetical protein PXX77_05265 [Gallionella sp.]|nr:hypothetical protein [Gallionella sp.]
MYPVNSAIAEKPVVMKHFAVGEYIGSNVHLPASAPNLRCSEILSIWGEPHRAWQNGIESSLVYKHGLVWAGIMPIVFVPIPLALPVGRKSTTLECVDDVLMKVYGTETGAVAAYCGVLSEQPKYGCRFER